MARRAVKRQARGAVPADSARIRNEVAGIALVAFGVLTLVALFASPTAVLLYWWRSFLFTMLGWGALAVPLVLFTITQTDVVELWMVYVLAFLSGCVTALDNPARRSFVYELVGPAEISNAAGLNSMLMSATRVVGPALGGIVIATAGAMVVTAALLWLCAGHRSGSNGVLAWGAGIAERVTGLPGWASLPSGIATVSLLGAVFGMYWDISLHIDQGRDEGPLAAIGFWPRQWATARMFAGTAKGAQGLSFLVFPLSFVSSAYVRVESLPGWLQPFAEHQPLTVMIDAVRALTLGPAAAPLMEYATSYYVTRSLLWTAGILVFAVPVAVVRYRRG